MSTKMPSPPFVWSRRGRRGRIQPLSCAAQTKREVELRNGMISVDLDALVEAVEFVRSGVLTEHQAYVSVKTGAIYWVSDSEDLDADAPEDLEESDRYVAVPSKSDLGLGRSVALRFVEDQLPNELQTVRKFFAGAGAYSRFKDLLAAHGQLDAWYAFEASSTERALLEWCEAQGIDATQKSQA